MKPIHLLLAMVATATQALAADTPATSVVIEAPTSQERLAIGRKAIETKDWNRAITELNAVARAEPRNADVHNLLGYSYRKRTPPDLAKAFEHYKTALRLDPKHKGAHEYIGEAFLMDKNPAEADKHLAQLGRCQHGLAVALVAPDFIGHAQFLQEPQHTLGARVVEVVHGDHLRPFGCVGPML